jgi:peptidoglycan/xylan/chitin deacetylase (PgdA/CDA1 family)
MLSWLGWLLLSQLAPGPPVSALDAVVSRVDNGHGWVAITFDACATATQGYAFDRPIYRALEAADIPATIFVSGHWVQAHPDAMREMAANHRIEFGNHTFDHPHMPRLEVEQMRDEVSRTEEALAFYDKRSVAFRPPFGELDARVIDTVHRMGLPVVLWDVVSGDPSAKTTAEGMISTVLRKTRSGSIVIFHINGRGTKTAEALPTILRRLRDKGFTFVPLSRLLAVVDLAGTPPYPLPEARPEPSPPVVASPELSGGILCEPPELLASPSPFARQPQSPATSPVENCAEGDADPGSEGGACP